MATETASTEPDVPASVSEHLTLEDRTGLLRAMLGMRGIEERAMMLYRQGKVPGSFYDGFGQEAVSVGSTFAMSAQDRLCILHRDLGGHLVRGVPVHAHRDRFDQRRALARDRAIAGEARRLEGRLDVVAVDADAGEAVCGGALDRVDRELRRRRR